MENEKISKEEIRALNPQKLKEVEAKLRHDLIKLKLDQFSETGKHAGRAKSLKKTLARVLTHKNAGKSV